MKEFAHFYLQTGWIIAAILGVGVGLTCSGKTVIWWTVLMAIIAVLVLQSR